MATDKPDPLPEPAQVPNPELGGSFENNSQVRHRHYIGAAAGADGATGHERGAIQLGNDNATTMDGEVVFPYPPPPDSADDHDDARG